MNRLFTGIAFGLSVFIILKAGIINGHAADIWVNAHATVGGDGSSTKPFKTIQSAAQIAVAGDTIHVLPGIYRERVTPVRGGESGRPITYESEVLHEAIVTGSDVWSPAWQAVGNGLFAAVLDDILFSDTNYVDGGNPFRIAYNWDRERNRPPYPYATVHWTLGQVFTDDELLHETSSRKELEGATQAWWFDPAANRIEVNLGGKNPATRRMEITTRRGVFRPHKKGLGYIVVRGFVFEHCANQFPGEFWKKPEYAESGMVGTRGGHHWLIESNIIRQAKSIGLTFGTSGRENWDNELPAQADPPVSQVGFDRIIGNVFVANGAIGAMGYGHHDVEISGNLFISNNALLNTSYETGGLKTHFAYDLTVAGNWFMDNDCEGAWLDNTWKNCRVERNIFVGNRGKNLFFEMDDNSAATEARVCDNIFLLDGQPQLSPGGPKPIQYSEGWCVGIYGHDASGVRLENNLIAGDGYGIYFRKLVERKGGAARVTAYRNLLVGDKLTAVCLPAENPPHVIGNHFDANVYPDMPRPFVATGWSLAGAKVDQPVVDRIRQLALTTSRSVCVFGKPERPAGYYLSLGQWQKVMQFDTKSRKVKINWSFDQTNWRLKLILPPSDPLPASGMASLTKTDYFGRLFSNSAAVGPFVSLTGGTNIIQLPVPDWPEPLKRGLPDRNSF